MNGVKYKRPQKYVNFSFFLTAFFLFFYLLLSNFFFYFCLYFSVNSHKRQFFNSAKNKKHSFLIPYWLNTAKKNEEKANVYDIHNETCLPYFFPLVIFCWARAHLSLKIFLLHFNNLKNLLPHCTVEILFKSKNFLKIYIQKIEYIIDFFNYIFLNFCYMFWYKADGGKWSRNG